MPNESYIIEVSSNLLDWVEGGTISNVTGIAQYTDIQAATEQFQRFYRLKLVK
jgi:hypothetical protein